MAWIRWRKTSRGARLATVQWRDREGKIRSQALKTSDERVAEAHKRMIEATEEGKAPVEVVTDAATALERFLEHVQLTKAPGTLNYYEGKLRPLWRAWADRPLASWTRSMFEAHVRAHPKWSPRQIKMLVNTSRKFIAWAQEANVAAPDFVAGFRGPQVHRSAPTVLSPDDLQKLLAEAHGHTLEVRIALCGLLGLRKGESEGVLVQDVDWERAAIRVRGTKTHRDRVLPASDQLMEVLRRRRPDSGPLVGTSRSNANRDLKRLCVRAGVAPVSWHPLRHSFATIVARKHPLHVVQKLLGHRSITTTGIYMHAQDEDLRRAVEAL